MPGDELTEVLGHLVRIEGRLAELQDLVVEQRTVRDAYGTAEVARLLGKAEFTVREWCRLGRIRAEKRPCGRGRSREWMISHAELTRLRSEGLLPLGEH